MARSLDDAGRMFANRFARRLFGRGGRCLSIQRTYPEHRARVAGMFRAVVGTLRGARTEISFLVTAHERTAR
jgi:hypothetical protein